MWLISRGTMTCVLAARFITAARIKFLQFYGSCKYIAAYCRLEYPSPVVSATWLIKEVASWESGRTIVQSYHTTPHRTTVQTG